ncbi:MAG: hypothetical protein A3F54_05675 [Candidatus Kerfeldbacteria bacterium RIFCSPHIGHO2_12_FULL_48_17]|uniref:Peptidase M16 n=1 Tax=Candidatus Kerfeldbacteria bacterium RIFCSPHIGHO2_12_FULL_48_17 TaxID=1798542 RepID=A0A1G2B8N0_9BACT|nr:MAG: hypothetical protein A3F54_05675 [Candidatus Kerfeldbacteria bacterium RIFCSPHIGHO2_12_FULL_48_17]
MKYHLQKLKNGLRIVTAPLHDTKVVTVLIMFKVGSRYEAKNINGVSHFLEHLFFKGTKNRPTTLEISQTLDSVGADYNAFTSKEWTGYYIKLEHQKLELALDMLSDMLFNSLFEPKEIERERGVIIEEINMYEDNPMATVEERLERLLYGNNPLGRAIAGPKPTIKKITRQQILKYRQSHYHAGNTVIAVAGKLNAQSTGLIKKYFGGNKFKKQQEQAYEKVSVKQSAPQLNLKYKKTEQSHLAFGWAAYPIGHEKLEALQLASVILGGNMSSRLFISIRERKGLCYLIRSSITPYQDIGNLVIQAGIDKKRIKPAIEAILKEVDLLRDKGVSEEELRKAKDFMKGKLVLQLEDSEEIANWLVQRILFNEKNLTPEEKIKRLEKITTQDILRVANEVFRPDTMNLAIIGPFREHAEFKKLLHF